MLCHIHKWKTVLNVKHNLAIINSFSSAEMFLGQQIHITLPRAIKNNNDYSFEKK